MSLHESCSRHDMRFSRPSTGLKTLFLRVWKRFRRAIVAVRIVFGERLGCVWIESEMIEAEKPASSVFLSHCCSQLAILLAVSRENPFEEEEKFHISKCFNSDFIIFFRENLSFVCR